MQTGVRVSVSTRRSSVGRPEATSHAAIEEAAFALFAERGFEATTIDDIARAVGVSRRTLFRYYPSKNDIPGDSSIAPWITSAACWPNCLSSCRCVRRSTAG